VQAFCTDDGKTMTTHPAATPPPDTTTGAEPHVVRNDEEGRYEIRLGEVLAGFTQFRPDAHGRLVFPHTEVDPAFKGQGLGGILVGRARAGGASRGETIVPRCPYVVRWLHRHDVPGLRIDWPNAPDFVR
jgi:predicted GNAT family acetyltransferase